MKFSSLTPREQAAVRAYRKAVGGEYPPGEGNGNIHEWRVGAIRAVIASADRTNPLAAAVETLKCVRCGAPWTGLGALEFSPPMLNGMCMKWHVCFACWERGGKSPPVETREDGK